MLLQETAPKSAEAGWIDYEHPLTVACLGLSRWILHDFKRTDWIDLKMGIEGAE